MKKIKSLDTWDIYAHPKPYKQSLFFCNICGEEIPRRTGHGNKQNVCSRKCRGISEKGDANPCAKLTEEEVLRIRHVYIYGRMGGYKNLSRIFNVSPTTIRYIVKRKTWKHI